MKQEAAATAAPQPPPTPGEGDVWQELIDAEPPGPVRDLMIARREQGIAKYGTPLQRGNGRDFRVDAIQEALDGIAYSRGALNLAAVVAFRHALTVLVEPIKVASADVSPGDYADGHLSGDQDRMFRCRQDIARALDLNDAPPADWGSLVATVRGLVSAKEASTARALAAEKERDEARANAAEWYARAEQAEADLAAHESAAPDAHNATLSPEAVAVVSTLLGGIKSQADGKVHAMVDAVALHLAPFGVKAKRSEVSDAR